jgi:hypothetical protein
MSVFNYRYISIVCLAGLLLSGICLGDEILSVPLVQGSRAECVVQNLAHDLPPALIETNRSVFRPSTPSEEKEDLARAAHELLPEVREDEAVHEIQDLETEALKVMKQLLPKNHEQSQAPIREWLDNLRIRQQQGINSGVMAHNALTFGLRSGVFDKIADQDLRQEARALLRQSWKDLTGKDVDEAKLTDRLPKRVLRRASRKEVLYQNAIYADDKLGFLGRLSQAKANYVAKPQDYFMSLAFMGTLFSGTGGSEALAGLMIGYSSAAITAHFSHDIIGHASKATIDMLEGLGTASYMKYVPYQEQVGYVAYRTGDMIKKWTAAHENRHHAEFSRNYSTSHGDFDPEDPNYAMKSARNERYLEAYTEQQKEKIPGLDKVLKDSKNGSTFGSILYNMVGSAPVSAAMIIGSHYVGPLVGLHPNWLFDVSAYAGSNLFMAEVSYFHKNLHIPKSKTAKDMDPFMRWFMTTRFALRASRLHAGHHTDPKANLKLLTDVGLDHIRGTHREPKVEDLLRLEATDSIY